ncbi:unnamed protein product [Leptidea sinapis]|uniref:Chitin-binding type-2 domain-containing protein n=1 Tax=Leptidea sinapis TaxID=189913 RepID=A0A5E4PVV9_9NEOP|nr:unnamed protein product [Leptidea sinapis]
MFSFILLSFVVASVHKTCPDGLHYDPSVKWPGYPCGYPADVPCKGRGAAQAAEPTKDCPHQFGFFASTAASPNDCGRYRMCVAGHAVEMSCPTGLAFNPILSRCDWPFNVPSCNVDAFLAYKCPAASIDASGNAIVTNHKYEGNCYAFYSCEAGESRLLSCDAGLAFDPTNGYCVDEDRVDCGVNAVPQQSAPAALINSLWPSSNFNHSEFKASNLPFRYSLVIRALRDFLKFHSTQKIEKLKIQKSQIKLMKFF